jgi:DNA primase
MRRGVMLASGYFGGSKRRLIHNDLDEPMISWYPFPADPDSVTLVEDQISAMKYRAATGNITVALLGTHLTVAAAGEIQRYAKRVTIALDADATAKAFAMARRWGAAFETCKVKILTKDIKDDPHYDTV